MCGETDADLNNFQTHLQLAHSSTSQRGNFEVQFTQKASEIRVSVRDSFRDCTKYGLIIYTFCT